MSTGPQSPLRPARGRVPRQGQVVLSRATVEPAPEHQVATLYRLSDPALSELGLEEFLNELLERVREAISADTVAILMFDDETQQLVARAAVGIEEEVERGVRIPIGHGFAGRIAAERVPIYIADVDHADILNPLLRARGIRSLLGIPLIVEGNLIGVLHVGSLTPRVFDERDVAVLEVAAARAGPGIERARLSTALQREHGVAMSLQRSLLPKQMVQIAGVTTATRYLPSGDEVGGDWYDLFELPRGRVGIAIGDVAGHGLRAAAVMGQLRTALHAYASEGHGPARAFELLDAFVQDLPELGMATAIYAILDPETGHLRLASAGHLPPLVVGHGRARLLDITPSAPLGAVRYVRREEVELHLQEEEMLVLYTDGLVEVPRTPLDESLEELVTAVAPADTAENACQLAIALLPLELLRDDVALVVVHRDPVPEMLSLKLEADARVLADVRRHLRRWLRSRGVDEDMVGEATIAANEACANAIEHAYGPGAAEFTLAAETRGDELTVVVRDRGRWRAPRGENRGRGLSIIDAAMDTVEVNTGEAGTELVMRRRLG
jgi:serine phosphatase RsbU (regulator of sigma subunit)/anti-sigma regulatory factor (Ser/Thr protein kinase)